MAANESFVGKNVGLKGLKTALKSEAASFGATSGLLELATGGSKVKAVWESIKWGAMAQAGVAGIALIGGAVLGLRAGIHQLVTDSGVLQAALQRLGETKVLTNQFTAFMGSVDAAKKRVAELYAFTVNSKFNLGEITNASRALTILSQGTAGGAKDLQMLGRVASATGNDLQELSMAYGRLIEQARNNEDISGTASELQHMGVISEATAKHLVSLQQAGQSGNTVLKEFQGTLQATAAVIQTGGDSVEELQGQIDKLKNEAAAAFGAPWMEEQTNELKRQIVFWNAITPAAGKFGEALQFATAPLNILKGSMAAVEKTDAFKSSLSTLAQMAAFLPTVIAGYFSIKGIASGTAKKAITGIPTAISTGLTFAKSLTPSGGEKQLLELSRKWAAQAKEMEGITGAAMKGLSKAAGTGASGMVQLGKAFAWVGTKLGPFAIGTGVVIAATYVAVKAWDAWRESVQRAARVSNLMNEAMSARTGIDKQIAGLKTMDDRSRLLIKTRQELNDAIAKQGEVRANIDSTKAEQEAADNLVRARRSALRKAEATGPGLGAGSKTLEQKQAQVRVEQEIADIVFQAEFARATGAKQALMLSERILENTKRVAEYVKSETQAPEIADLDDALSKGHEARAGEADKLKARYMELIEQASSLQEIAGRETILQGGGAGGGGGFLGLGHVADFFNVRPVQVFEDQVKIAARSVHDLVAGKGMEAAFTPPKEQAAALLAEAEEVKAKQISLRKKTASEEEQEAQRTAKLTGPKAARFDRFTEEARLIRAKEGQGGEAKAQALDIEAYKAKVIDKETAEKKIIEDQQQLKDMERQGKLRRIELGEHEKLLGITSDTYEAQDQAARIQMESVDKQRALLEETPVSRTGDKAVDDQVNAARANQARGYEQEQAELQKGINERAMAREREKIAFAAVSKSRTLENTALLAATNGHFAEADAAFMAAQQITDQQADRDRAFQLQREGWSEVAVAARVAAESTLRQADREAATSAFIIDEKRRVQELQLEAITKGQGKALGLGQDTGLARKQLQAMKDIDLFRDELKKNMKSMPGRAGEAADLALKATKAQLAIETTETEGRGAVASSLARVGGGGGVYAGAEGGESEEFEERTKALEAEAAKAIAMPEVVPPPAAVAPATVPPEAAKCPPTIPPAPVALTTTAGVVAAVPGAAAPTPPAAPAAPTTTTPAAPVTPTAVTTPAPVPAPSVTVAPTPVTVAPSAPVAVPPAAVTVAPAPVTVAPSALTPTAPVQRAAPLTPVVKDILASVGKGKAPEPTTKEILASVPKPGTFIGPRVETAATAPTAETAPTAATAPEIFPIVKAVGEPGGPLPETPEPVPPPVPATPTPAPINVAGLAAKIGAAPPPTPTVITPPPAPINVAGLAAKIGAPPPAPPAPGPVVELKPPGAPPAPVPFTGPVVETPTAATTPPEIVVAKAEEGSIEKRFGPPAPAPAAPPPGPVVEVKPAGPAPAAIPLPPPAPGPIVEIPTAPAAAAPAPSAKPVTGLPVVFPKGFGEGKGKGESGEGSKVVKAPLMPSLPAMPGGAAGGDPMINLAKQGNDISTQILKAIQDLGAKRVTIK